MGIRGNSGTEGTFIGDSGNRARSAEEQAGRPQIFLSPVAAEAIERIGQLYAIEEEIPGRARTRDAKVDRSGPGLY